MVLSDRQFDRTRQLAARLAGIELFDRHRELLVRRGQRLGIPDSAALDTLLSEAEEGTTTATNKLICLLTTKFTGFFRHPRHFQLAAQQAVQAAQARGRARLWSAACATGEEPYSLAMTLCEAFQQADPPAEVLATDVDTDALTAAEQGAYGDLAMRTVSPARRHNFFCRPDPGKPWSLLPATRRLVQFCYLNLVSRAWQLEGFFDVVFCRNALMYLGAQHRLAVLERVASLLNPGGLLMLDPSEHLGPAGDLFISQTEGVFSLAPAARRTIICDGAARRSFSMKTHL